MGHFANVIVPLLAGCAKTMVVSILSECLVLMVLVMLSEWAAAKSTNSLDDRLVEQLKAKLKAEQWSSPLKVVHLLVWELI